MGHANDLRQLPVEELNLPDPQRIADDRPVPEAFGP